MSQNPSNIRKFMNLLNLPNLLPPYIEKFPNMPILNNINNLDKLPNLPNILHLLNISKLSNRPGVRESL